MFEKASRMKLRFAYKGSLSVEDLWDLDVEELDALYKKFNKDLKETSEESLLKVTRKSNIPELKVNIIKHIVEIKLAEAEEKEKLVVKRQQKKRILEIIATKQDAELLGKSMDELTAMVDQL
jgi:hypothetical protein